MKPLIFSGIDLNNTSKRVKAKEKKLLPMLINISIAGCACLQVLVAANEQYANNNNKPCDDKDLKLRSRNLNHYTRRPTRRPTKKPTRRPTRRNGNIFNDEDVGSAEDSFRLKLYWQSSYRWQDLSTDPRFCMRKLLYLFCTQHYRYIVYVYKFLYHKYIIYSECDGGSCRQGDTILIQRCGSSITQQFVASGLTIRPASDTSLCFTIMGYSSARDTDGNIITTPIQLQDCNGDFNQEFNGYQSNGQFELTPKNRGDRCLGTAHHPKSSEKVHPKSCDGGRRATTAFWVTY